MNHDVSIITDPLGNAIHLPHGCIPNTNKIEGEHYDDATTVILKPAMMFRVDENKMKSMFYFRKISWDRTMLIIVKFQHGRWESTECIMDPSTEMLSQIMKNGTQLI